MAITEQKLVTPVSAIRSYFADSIPVTLQEFKALSREERQELGELACTELGIKIGDPQK